MSERQFLKQSSRNGEIELFRFIFAVIVFSFHFEYAPAIFKSGYLCVEFFFVLSGYFLMQHIEKNKNTVINPTLTVFNYTKNRLKRLYVSYFIACVAAFAIRFLVLSDISIRTVVNKGIWEILMLQTLGYEFSTTVVWYVSALLIASVIIYLLSYCLKDYFLPVIFFGAFVILAFLCQKNQQLSSMNNLLIVSDGLLRGLAELSLGCILFKIIKAFPNSLNKFRKFLFVPKYLSLAIILYFMTKDAGVKDFSCLIFIVFFISMLFLDESPIHKVFNNKLCYFLGDISYDFYLNQIIVIYFARVFPSELLQKYPIITFVVFVIVDLILSLITKRISKAIISKVTKKAA
ncbi:MAG: acyltransferase family protein [Acutalibacteraceae bacterium]|nr:acyltransferase family protein [Acutalibacteraceae bacterium]